jgi:predicted HicB family RNase H-like nuclease
MIDYKGYTGVFEFDPTIDCFHGRVVGLQDVVTFEGRSVEELRHEMEESIEDYLELCAEAGKEPERSYRGEFLVRTTPEVHRAVATAAEAAGMSLNAWVETTITTIVAERRSVSPKTSPTGSATRGRKRSTRTSRS